ncbi:MAG: phosphate signaling complex protein PhoU [Fimbriimonas ginsengisoli]|uniref:Phosphate-specific transport system accessory protein PhoU n=1 Tax=Fimbriimonas ginsengisoli TaxID=1005039 RepID=A0A931LTH7_FIMGI|nr:phosphate signaling complex protein PhoU [Fimbriimonas ginsengisoli]
MENPGFARHAYAEEIQALGHDLLDMASRAESMVGLAVEALVRLDKAKAMEVIHRDDEIDEADIAIESRCLRLLALQQPIAGDFRLIGTALRMIVDIERIGDLAVDIAKISMKIEAEFGKTSVIDVPRIAGVARSMLRVAIEAFVKHDLGLVQRVIEQDDEVDALYRDLRGQLHANMRANPDLVVADSWLLLAIHHVERIADHAVNIAERVAFMVTGRLEQLSILHQSAEPHG